MSKRQYPQAVFSKNIINSLTLTNSDKNTILDCPCGDGIISANLSDLKNTNVIGVDIDNESILRAQGNFNKPNLKYFRSDVFEFLSKNEIYDAICLVNSIFLLDDHEILLANISHNLKSKQSQFVVIIPNIMAKNFKSFTLENPSTNKKIYTKEEFKIFLERAGFKILKTKEIVYADHYRRKELKFFSVFAPFYMTFLNFIYSLSPSRQGNYLLFNCSKNE